jgi:hypothetical protein
VLTPGGDFVLERCRAPDYAIPDGPGGPLPVPLAQCELVVDGVISRLDEARIVVGRGQVPPRTFRYLLVRGPATELLRLSIGEETVELVAGSKNSLFERLHRLPSDVEARARYMRRMIGDEG